MGLWVEYWVSIVVGSVLLKYIGIPMGGVISDKNSPREHAHY